MLFRSIEPLNPFPHRMQQCSLLLLSLSEDLIPGDSRILIHFATPHSEWKISGSLSATQRDKPSCNNDQQTASLKSFLHSHSLRSFSPPSGFLFGSLYSLRPRLIMQMQDTEPTLPNPDVFSLQHAPPQFYSSDPSVSHHTWAPTLHSYSFQYIHNYPARLLVQRKISTAQPSWSPNRPPPLSIYPLHPRVLPSALLFYPLHPQEPKLFPSSSLLTIIRAASLLSFVSHTSREKPPCILCSRHGEIPAAKLMTANKTKLNLKNMLCSH